ncbi:hypothetical protein OTU49_000670 [Cherax quadricarinatus]|uniref:Endonuclease/exonuclease/phosphatase domain-containing protein n=1 Tax=Cherax quadricarinatus TaxID=27406 RepID=A0AAW0XWP9_CHEQU|nr:uncharacterized protein LOC128689043 [Cherax quadricarinatus]
MAGAGSRSALPTVLLANVQSLADKLEDLKKRLEDRDIDVCALTEARIGDAAQAEIEGYTLWLQTRPEKKHGGLALYVRDDITSTVLPFHVPSNLDVLWVRVDPRGLPSDVSCVVFCVVHHTHPHTSGLREPLMAHLMDVVTGIYSREPDTGVVILGGFRDFPEHKIPPDLNLQQVVNKPTHRGSIMDVIVTNLMNHYKKPRLLRPIASSAYKSVYWVSK